MAESLNYFLVALTKHPELDLVGGHAPHTVARGADVRPGVVLLHIGDVEDGALRPRGH